MRNNGPEGSIAEGYLTEECLTFCSRYLEGVETKFNRPTRNDDVLNHDIENLDMDTSSIFSLLGRHLGKGITFVLDNETRTKAHQYVLNNCEKVAPFIK